MYAIPPSLKMLTVDAIKCESTGVFSFTYRCEHLWHVGRGFQHSSSCIILVYQLSTFYFMLLTLGIRILKL